MAYTKQTWATGDTITAAKLNHMEDGIAAGGSANRTDLKASLKNYMGASPIVTMNGLSFDELWAIVSQNDIPNIVFFPITAGETELFKCANVVYSEYTTPVAYNTIRFSMSVNGATMSLELRSNSEGILNIDYNGTQISKNYTWTYDSQTKDYTWTLVS